jgi:hypothetical protein
MQKPYLSTSWIFDPCGPKKIFNAKCYCTSLNLPSSTVSASSATLVVALAARVASSIPESTEKFFLLLKRAGRD